MKGKVYLVGAGPGDIGLLTVKGLRCLQKAEVVIYDFHLNAQVLNYINHDSEFIYAGKRGGRHTITQEGINDILVQKAKEGKIICRLKGGDPFIFGRGGEEAEALVENGIEFEVVPGVSSSVVAPAYAGIPLTHRDYAASVAIITGHRAGDSEKPIDWVKIANAVDTMVILMGVESLEGIVSKLLKGGVSPKKPVAMVESGTYIKQRTL